MIRVADINYLKLRKILLLVGVLFLAFLIFSVLYKSNTRKSLLDDVSSNDHEKELADSLTSPIQKKSELHLQDFRRVSVKNGRRIWEIKAKDAKYYSNDSLARVSDADVIIYRTKKSKVKFSARSGNLFLEGDTLNRAEMEGELKLLFNKSMILTTDRASYDAKAQTIVAPGLVTVTGPGFVIHGKSMEFFMETEIMILDRDVDSRFEPKSQPMS